MSELALYRKYRSQTFEQVVGQPHVVTTLTNALKLGRISHAYLLTGPRGVGKTSVARLLARAANCQGEASQLPCNICDICLIPLTSNMDIIEIDAASNRRIDEIRDLRDKINLSPARSRYKIYIIDEVHMLTNEAFNALLKTLEEPPSHAIFILATTESHKLPETIISRTQRFSFKAITKADLTGHLGAIAEKEGIIIEAEALSIITEASHGSFRDAISLLDQVSGGGKERITTKNVNSLLGLTNSNSIIELTSLIASREPGKAIKIIDELAEQGAQIPQLVMQLVEHWRKIMLLKLSGSGTSDNNDPASNLNERDIASIITRLSSVLVSPLPDVALEIALVELGTPKLVESSAQSTPNKKPSPALSPPPPTPPKISPATNANQQASMQTLWPKALMLIKVKNNSLYALLCSCGIEIDAGQVVISCRFNFHRDRIDEPKNRAIIEAALAKVYGQPMRAVSQLESSSSLATQAPIDPTGELVSSALEILGGEVVDD